MIVFAIDPGTFESGFVIYNPEKKEFICKGKIKNEELLILIHKQILSTPDSQEKTIYAIEMISGQGMAVGQETFDTCVWIGRFYQELLSILQRRVYSPEKRIKLVYRRVIKLHHCGTSRAKDPNIKQALVDKYAYGVSNHGKGKKDNPGFFYGFKSDIWQAFALAAYIAETQEK